MHDAVIIIGHIVAVNYTFVNLRKLTMKTLNENEQMGFIRTTIHICSRVKLFSRFLSFCVGTFDCGGSSEVWDVTMF